MDSSNFGPLVGLLLLLVGAVVCVVIFTSNAKEKEEAKQQRLDRLQEEATAFFDRLNREGGLKPVATGLLLQKDEFAVLEEASVLRETRAYRIYGGGGTRIGRVYVGGGVSESEQRLKQIDSGTLTLTTKRLVFDGGRENRAIQLSDVLSVKPRTDAIEVSTAHRAKSLVFIVLNPVIWSLLIEHVASGKFSVVSKPDDR